MREKKLAMDIFGNAIFMVKLKFGKKEKNNGKKL